MKRSLLSTLIRSLFFPGVLGAQIPAVSQAGSIPDPASMAAAMTAIGTNAASVAGGVNYATTSGTSATLTSLGELLELLTAGSATTITLDSAYNICKTLPGPLAVGQNFSFRIATNAATTVATPTLSDTAVTLSGTTSCVANAVREYLGTITQVASSTGMATSPGTTFTSLTQVGSTNNYTVALGTNSLSPSVGQLIYLNVTSGTLPSGWYPINKVTSATSFVIAAPAAAAAWTATAATVGTGNPATPVYSPLVTIQGLMSVAGTVTA